jgi:hypothetical protein
MAKTEVTILPDSLQFSQRQFRITFVLVETLANMQGPKVVTPAVP